MHDCSGLLGGALVLSKHSLSKRGLATDGLSGSATGMRIVATLDDDSSNNNSPAPGALARHAANNPMAQMLALYDALAVNAGSATLKAAPGRVLRLDIAYD